MAFRSRWQASALSVGFVLLGIAGLILVIYPFWPRLQYALFPKTLELDARELPTATGTTVAADARARLPQPAGRENRLYIPKIGVDIPVVEGGEEALNRGAWRMPQTSNTPDAGNMVLSAHRFRYKPPSRETFYLLDKIAVGDTFLLQWDGHLVTYRVIETKVVDPSAVEILDPTPRPRITLFTCTPLFSIAKRLVVIGEPV